MEMPLRKSENDLWYFELLSGAPHHTHIRVWVRNKPVANGDEKEFPSIVFSLVGAKVKSPEKGTFILVPNEGTSVHIIWHPSGYRGTSNIDISGDCETVAKGKQFHSEQGALGETSWALVNAWGETRVTGLITGRRVVDGSIYYRILPSGKVVQSREERLEELLK